MPLSRDFVNRIRLIPGPRGFEDSIAEDIFTLAATSLISQGIREDVALGILNMLFHAARLESA